MLNLTDVHVSYGHVNALQGISFSVDQGEILALVGSNGAGKSSTLKAIMGLVRPSQGTIEVNGRSLRQESPADIVRLGVGYSPEGRRPFPRLNVYENLRMGGYTLSNRDLRSRLEEVYSYFPVLQERSNQVANSLSGGEQQMLAIGRALMSKPKVLLLDEPSLGLAPVMVQNIGRLIDDIQSKEAIAVVLAEQNANWSMRLAHRAVVLTLGKVSAAGTSSELLNDPSIQRTYLGI
jgi:branched-chain amino acid transport system ATP-binding protein